MNNDSCTSSATNSLDTPQELECPRARKLINDLEKPFPGPLDFDPFPHITKHLLIDLASEVAKCHISVTRAQKVYEKICKCQPSYDRKISSSLRDLLGKIFVPDPDMRISISQIKKHPIFKDIDFQMSMVDQVSKKSAPFIPPNPLFNEDV
jgi:serine/threonine protein kinase